ncbi:MAG: fumarylacetoacetate hydrolase family protein [Saccharofermentanales bacterium]
MSLVFKLATVDHRGFVFPVIEINSSLYDINRGYEYYKMRTGKRDLFKAKHNYTMLDILEEWELFNNLLGEMAGFYNDNPSRTESFVYEEDDIAFKPPVLYPDKILNAGSNYYDHALEMGAAKPKKDGHEPYFFYKGRTHTIIGHGDPIRLTPRSNFVDWEAEMAIVIGKSAKDVPAEKALDYVAGYTCYNDISARDRMIRHDETFDFDWFSNKGNDTFGPLGPYITPAQFIPDIDNLSIRLYLNGEIMQNTNTNLMVWSVAELIATASSVTTLSPGDVIATGTGAGVGMAKGANVGYSATDKLFDHMYAGKSILLKAEDVLEVEIERLGRLINIVKGYQ